MYNGSWRRGSSIVSDWAGEGKNSPNDPVILISPGKAKGESVNLSAFVLAGPNICWQSLPSYSDLPYSAFRMNCTVAHF